MYVKKDSLFILGSSLNKGYGSPGTRDVPVQIHRHTSEILRVQFQTTPINGKCSKVSHKNF